METSTLRPQTPRAEVEPEDKDEASSPLTISELAYRLVELQNMVSASRNSSLEPLCCLGDALFCLLLHPFQLLRLLD